MLWSNSSKVWARIFLALGIALATSPTYAVETKTETCPLSSPVHYEPLDFDQVKVTAEPITVTDHWVLHLYTFFHSRDYQVHRIEFPGSSGELQVAHFSVPNRDGPHPTIVVYPILAGSHLVSEGLSKALVDRGYAVLRLERQELFPEDDMPSSPEIPAKKLLNAIQDGRKLLDWLSSREEVDSDRLAAAGVSIGGITAATLMGVDDRIKAGIFLMIGGDIAEILGVSEEPIVETFRETAMEANGYESVQEFIEGARICTEPMDPMQYVQNIPARNVVLVSGRYDRIIPEHQTEILWSALGEPTWHTFPAGHYYALPYFWWATDHGADHLDAVFAREGSND